MSESRTVRRRFGPGRRGGHFLHPPHSSFHSGLLQIVVPGQGPPAPASLWTPRCARQVGEPGSFGLWEFGGETDWSEGPSGLSWRPYLWGWRRQAGRGAVQSAGLGHVSCAGPARPALPGFKGPCSAKLPSRPLWAPLSPAWPWHRGRRAPFLALASPTLPVRSRCARPSTLRAWSASGPFSPPQALPRFQPWLELGKKRCHCELSILNI